jgi:hypothetical protein
MLQTDRKGREMKQGECLVSVMIEAIELQVLSSVNSTTWNSLQCVLHLLPHIVSFYCSILHFVFLHSFSALLLLCHSRLNVNTSLQSHFTCYETLVSHQYLTFELKFLSMPCAVHNIFSLSLLNRFLVISL